MIPRSADTIAGAAGKEWGAQGARVVERPAAFSGASPLVLLEPPDATTVAAMLRWADAEGLAVVAAGARTKLTWGAGPLRADVLLSTARLNEPIEHCAGDLTGTLPAGTTLQAANAALGREGQWLPLDPPFLERATIGGIVATLDSGPRRLRYGSPRDLIIGVEMATVDGRVSKAGGRVVKNVAGYDLSRLMCGSYGSLAVITSATFKLAPLPPASRTVVATVPDVEAAAALALAIAQAPLTPSALEIEVPGPRLLIRFETTAAAADRQATAVRALCGRHGAASELLAGSEQPATWQRTSDRIWIDSIAVLKICVLPTQVAAACRALETAAAATGARFAASGRAAMGVLLCRLDGDLDQIVAAVRAIRTSIPPTRGSVVLLSSPPALKGRIDPWGEVGDAFGLMQKVKAQFDPKNTLNPGRGPGGL
jgi:glycolate oxidase FAD binding subunit